MSDFKGFTQDDVELVNAFGKEFLDNNPGDTAKIETNNNWNDTIDFGRYCIIKDEMGICQSYAQEGKFSYDSGWDAVERQIGVAGNLQVALMDCAVEHLGAKIDGFFQIYSSRNEPELI